MYMTCEHTNENLVLLSCEMPFNRPCIRKVLFRYVFCSEHHNRFYLKRLFHKPCDGMIFPLCVFCNVCLDCHSLLVILRQIWHSSNTFPVSDAFRRVINSQLRLFLQTGGVLGLSLGICFWIVRYCSSVSFA